MWQEHNAPCPPWGAQVCSSASSASSASPRSPLPAGSVNLHNVLEDDTTSFDSEDIPDPILRGKDFNQLAKDLGFGGMSNDGDTPNDEIFSVGWMTKSPRAPKKAKKARKATGQQGKDEGGGEESGPRDGTSVAVD